MLAPGENNQRGFFRLTRTIIVAPPIKTLSPILTKPVSISNIQFALTEEF